MIGTVTLNPSLDEWVELDRLRPGRLNRATHFRRYPGGKGINVSRVVRELGGQTCAYGVVGGDDGRILRAMLARLGVPHRFVHVAGCTRNNYKLVSRAPRGLTEINAPGPRVTPAILARLAGSLTGAVRRVPLWALSGSLPPGCPATVYARWIRRLQRRGARVLLDTSGPALRAGLAARPWAIKPNRSEAEELLGRRLRTGHDEREAAQALLQRGPAVVMLSLGSDGALLASRQLAGVWRAEGPRVRVRSAVGAGDSLVGGFLLGWRRMRDLREAFRLGIACATACVLTPGTELCHRSDVLRLRPRVRLHLVPEGSAGRRRDRVR